MKDIFKITASSLVVLFVLLFCFSLLCLSCFLSIFTFSGLNLGEVEPKIEYISGNILSKNKILHISLNGVLLTNRVNNDPFDIFGNIGAVFAEDIKKIVGASYKDSNIKAVLIDINSPGGTAVGAEIAGKAIQDLRRDLSIPVYTYISDIGASASYYIASASDKIFASDSSLVGSIGVILGTFPVYKDVRAVGDILTDGGIEFYTFSAGKSKDFGSGFRDITKEEMDHYNQILESNYKTFIQFISTNRNISEQELREKIGAYLFDGNTAKDIGLLDQIGTRDDLINYFLNDLGIQNSDYQLVGIKPNISFFSGLLNQSKKEIEFQNCPLLGIVLYLHGDPMQYCTKFFKN